MADYLLFDNANRAAPPSGTGGPWVLNPDWTIEANKLHPYVGSLFEKFLLSPTPINSKNVNFRVKVILTVGRAAAFIWDWIDNNHFRRAFIMGAGGAVFHEHIGTGPETVLLNDEAPSGLVLGDTVWVAREKVTQEGIDGYVLKVYAEDGVEVLYTSPMAVPVNTTDLPETGLWGIAPYHDIDEVQTDGISTGPETVATPTFSHAAGQQALNTPISFQCATAGVTFHYTTDGSTPTTASPTGTSVTLTADMTLKVIAVKAGMTSSAVASRSFTIPYVPGGVPAGTVRVFRATPPAGGTFVPLPGLVGRTKTVIRATFRLNAQGVADAKVDGGITLFTVRGANALDYYKARVVAGVIEYRLQEVFTFDSASNPIPDFVAGQAYTVDLELTGLNQCAMKLNGVTRFTGTHANLNDFHVGTFLGGDGLALSPDARLTMDSLEIFSTTATQITANYNDPSPVTLNRLLNGLGRPRIINPVLIPTWKFIRLHDIHSFIEVSNTPQAGFIEFEGQWFKWTDAYESEFIAAVPDNITLLINGGYRENAPGTGGQIDGLVDSSDPVDMVLWHKVFRFAKWDLTQRKSPIRVLWSPWNEPGGAYGLNSGDPEVDAVKYAGIWNGICDYFPVEDGIYAGGAFLPNHVSDLAIQHIPDAKLPRNIDVHVYANDDSWYTNPIPDSSVKNAEAARVRARPEGCGGLVTIDYWQTEGNMSVYNMNADDDNDLPITGKAFAGAIELWKRDRYQRLDLKANVFMDSADKDDKGPSVVTEGPLWEWRNAMSTQDGRTKPTGWTFWFYDRHFDIRLTETVTGRYGVGAIISRNAEATGLRVTGYDLQFPEVVADEILGARTVEYFFPNCPLGGTVEHAYLVDENTSSVYEDGVGTGLLIDNPSLATLTYEQGGARLVVQTTGGSQHHVEIAFSGSGNPDSAITSITPAPTSATVYAGAGRRFTATVAGTGDFDDSVTWSKVVSGNPLTLYPQSDGSVIVLVAANATPGAYQVRATSVQEGSKTGTATITVEALPTGGGGAERPTWELGEVDFSFNIVESSRRLDAEGDQPLLITVVAQLLNGQFLPTTDFDPEISVVSNGENVWQTATWAPGARASLPVVGDVAEPLEKGSYVVSIRLKNAVGTILRSDRLGIIDVS
ncbi:MAG: chitobiase/beta-hexosaminidase C-terminal domain-containing protein [Armatimonadota bacterium]